MFHSLSYLWKVELCFSFGSILWVSLFHRCLRVGAVWPSPSSHGCHGQRLLRSGRRTSVARHRYFVPWLAHFSGCEHFTAAASAFILVVSQAVASSKHVCCVFFAQTLDLMCLICHQVWANLVISPNLPTEALPVNMLLHVLKSA